MNQLLRKILLAMILGMVLYGAFAFYRGTREIADSLVHFRWSAFGMACALAFGNYLTRFLKWEYYLAGLGIRGVPKLDSLLTFLSGLVLTVTPGKVGEVFKSLVLNQAFGVPVARTAPIVLAERLTDVLGIVIMILVGSAGFQNGIKWAVTGAALVVVLLVAIGSDDFFLWVVGRVERGPARLRAVVPKIREGWDSLRELVALRRLAVPTVLSVLAWSLEGLALWVILRGFGDHTSVLVSGFFYATSTLAGALIPIPGGLGITEGTLEEQLWHIGHVGQFTATSATILVRLATLWFAVLIGFLSLGWMRARHPGLLREGRGVPGAVPQARV